MDAKKRRCLSCILWDTQNLSILEDQFKGKEEHSDVTHSPRGEESDNFVGGAFS